MSAYDDRDLAAQSALKTRLRAQQLVRAEALRHEGLTLPIIAQRLGVTIAVVRGLLGLDGHGAAPSRAARRKK